MFRFAFFCAFALPLVSFAQQPAPAPSPDYKTLYEQANDTAAKWKARADQLQAAGKDLSRIAQESLDREKAVEDRNIALQRELRALRASTGATSGATDDAVTAGVPPEVVAQIRAKAARDHPDNYGTQVYLIKSEYEAYRKLHGS